MLTANERSSATASAEPGAAERVLEEALRRAKFAKHVELADDLDALVAKLAPLRAVLRLARLRADSRIGQRLPTDKEWDDALRALDESCGK